MHFASRLPLRTHDERAGQPNGIKQAALFPQLYQPVALRVSKRLRRITAFERGVIKIEHDLHGRLITDRPECHQQILRAGLNKTAT